MSKIKTIKHTESLDDLFQMSDAMSQDIDSALLERVEELIQKIKINDPDEDIITLDYGIKVYITIKYKETK